MKEWMGSFAGIVTAALGSLAFITLALVANNHDKKDKDSIKYHAFVLWPYARDAMKGLRNTFRGVHSTLTLIHALDLNDFRQFIVPLSVLLGVVTVLNRILIRFNSSQRNKMMESNAKLLAEIKAIKVLDSTQIYAFRARIHAQSRGLRIQLLVSSAVSGMIDGLNRYIGTLTVRCIPNMLLAITSFCAVYFLVTLSIKISDELKAQQKLMD